MNLYTTKSINIISLILTIIIFFILNFIINLSTGKFENPYVDSNEFIQKSENENPIISEVDTPMNENKQEKKYDWYIEIKSIDLKAPIEETVKNEVLSKAVGHFEDTALKEGNIGLAAHNRGYEINYFENLKSVKIEDEIEYHYNDFSKIYIIDKIEIINDTDWSYLENTDKNKITLITCVENEPKLRRCVQATEKE